MKSVANCSAPPCVCTSQASNSMCASKLYSLHSLSGCARTTLLWGKVRESTGLPRARQTTKGFQHCGRLNVQHHKRAVLENGLCHCRHS
eukprot:6932703-Pyramimonas_sp.AAC.1